MRKRKIFTILLFFFMHIFTIACNSKTFNFEQNNLPLLQNYSYDYKKIYTKEQLKILNKYTNLFVNISKNDFTFLGNNTIKVKNNIYDYKTREPYKLNLYSDDDNNRFIEISKTGKTKNFEYDFLFDEKIDCFEKNDEKFHNDLCYPKINSIISEICRIGLHDKWNQTLPYFIPTKWIRAKAWIKNKEQISYWEDLALFYINDYDFGDLPKISKIKITPINFIESIDPNNYKNAPVISIDFIDQMGNSLISKTNREKQFILGGIDGNYLLENTPYNIKNYENIFKNYNSLNNYFSTLNIDDDEILFNEYVNTNFYPDVSFLRLKDNLFKKNNYYESFVSPGNNYEWTTAKSFLWFLKNKENNFYIPVPEFRKHIDKEYKIIDKKIDNRYLNNSLKLIKLTIQVTTIDGKKSNYKWYSIDINNHYHDFNGYKTTLDLDFKKTTKKYDWNAKFAKNNSWESDLPIKNYIDPNKFFENLLLPLMSIQVFKFKDNIDVFDGKKIKDYEAYKIYENKKPLDILESYLGLDIFKYLIGKSNNKNDLLNDIKFDFIQVSKDKPGTIELKIDFLDKEGKSMLSKENQEKVIEWNCFKGCDNTQRLEQVNPINSISYLIDEEKNKDLTPENVIKYFKWKE